jgi:hypothetical protein
MSLFRGFERLVFIEPDYALCILLRALYIGLFLLREFSIVSVRTVAVPIACSRRLGSYEMAEHDEWRWELANATLDTPYLL